jgi:hypothetical protein
MVLIIIALVLPDPFGAIPNTSAPPFTLGSIFA